MKLQTRTILAALLVCGCVGAFRAQAASYEYDFIPDLPLPTGVTTITGNIFLDAPSNPIGGGSASDILSYSIVINGTTTYNQNNSTPTITGTFLWSSTSIDTMLLLLAPNDNSTALSVTDTTINGGGLRHLVPGQWTSVPEQANTFALLLITMVALGGYRSLKQPVRRLAAVAVVKARP